MFSRSDGARVYFESSVFEAFETLGGIAKCLMNREKDTGFLFGCRDPVLLEACICWRFLHLTRDFDFALTCMTISFGWQRSIEL